MLESSAEFSPCRKYRYSLTRIWDRSLGLCQFIGLNPSTADEVENDPTVRRCINYAKDWGYGGLIMSNIFAFRATDPKVMKAQADPVGPENDMWLLDDYGRANCTVAAWGTHGSLNNRSAEVIELLSGCFHCLGLTKHGFPKHPLYLRKDEVLTWYSDLRKK